MRDYDEFKRDFSNMNLLARGGQKIVYSATHPQYGAIVIEFYFNLDDPRSKREIEIVKLVELQCVPRLFETGEILHEGSKTLYVVEEQILGYVLRERIASGERFTLIEAVNFLEQGLTFINQIEGRGIVHRDIKPENIIISTDGTVYFLDFGIARALNLPSLTMTEATMGPHTPGYAAPEQFNNLKNTIDSRADLFSIGVVTYECITGNNPFREGATSALDVLQKTETITPLAHVIEGDNQKQFMALLSSLMGKFPSRRPKNAEQALDWLTAAKLTLAL